MTRRSEFLAALGLTSAAAGLSPAPALGAAPGDATAAPTTPSPQPTATAKAPSAAALALAQTMRRFDPKLSDAEILTIARGIDENAGFAGAALDPKRKRLRNSEEPVTAFRVTGP